MSKIHIVTDSTAYIDKVFIQNNPIKVVPLSIHFEGEDLLEGFPGEFKPFFDRLANSEHFPSTSQPSVGSFLKIYNELLGEGNEIITITISSKLSGTFNSAVTAASLTDEGKVSVIDSETSSANLRLLVEIALKLANEGFTRDKIVEKLEIQKKRMGVNLTVATLDYLKKGGRLSNTSAFIGSLLNIKPILALREGKLAPVAKVRGKKKALEKMMEELPDDTKHIRICHIDALDEAENLKDILQERFPTIEIMIEELGPVIGSHLGPQSLGICYQF